MTTLDVQKKRKPKKYSYGRANIRREIDLKDRLYTDAIKAAASWHEEALEAQALAKIEADWAYEDRERLYTALRIIESLKLRWKFVLCAHVLGMVVVAIVYIRL